ncbi:MAG: hypothetical protein QNJ74_29175 [Trichodesmium sp. MO_231.B1]|nr:hypothetical protein [Trichodesmium sp. MO_231.B1]
MSSVKKPAPAKASKNVSTQYDGVGNDYHCQDQPRELTRMAIRLTPRSANVNHSC